MKKNIVIIFLSLVVHLLEGQEIEPSQQAQGYLNSKNATVDYSVGIFHYTVPLFGVNSGEYRLPISLEYTGKGVRENDNPGLLGYNWTLNAGGVITRISRGEPDVGDLNRTNSFADTSNIALLEAINLRYADGEKDIYSASFNNKRIDFILKGDPIPLEQTNVKIYCVLQRRIGLI